MITLTDSPMDAIVKLCAGNPGAIRVCTELVKTGGDDPFKGFMLLLDADDMGLKGSSLWIAYKDHCGQDINKLADSLRSRDKAMIATVRASGGEAWEGGRS
jgi:hypothetical protein